MREKRQKGVILIVCLFLMATLVLPLVSANPINETEQELDAIQQDLKEGKEDLREVKTKEQELTAKVRELEKSIEQIQQEISALGEQTETIERDIEETELELQETEKKLAERYGLLNMRLRAIYEQGSVNYLQVIFDANSFSDFLTRFNHLRLIVDQDTKLLQEVSLEKEEMALQKEELEEKKAKLVALQQASLIKKNQVEVQKVEHSKLLTAVREEYEKQERFIEEMEKEAKEIKNIIQQLEEAQRLAEEEAKKKAEEEARRKAEEEARKKAEEEAEKPEEEGEPEKEQAPEEEQTQPPTQTQPGNQLIWPLANYGVDSVTSWFGPRVHPITGEVGRMHWGIDIAALRGTPIRAAAAGVAYSYPWPENGSSYGNYVIIMHEGGLYTLYAHNSSNAVTNGQQVQSGQTIAYIGSTGASTGPHLHFEVWVGGQFQRVNPMDYFR